ncbi:MAG: hypothetical protein EAS52_18315 [Parapedobacter sp.]|nr:MAG: hypothetical protein EAS52_18315 [Parapedobacter sp.]
MAGWIISFICFALLLNVVGKQQKKGKNASLIRKILAGIVCFHINGMLSFLLYEPIMDIFDIDTDGFMNMNSVVTAAVIWMAIAIIVLLITSYAKELLADLYGTVRITQKVFLILPTIVLVMFLFAASFK